MVMEESSPLEDLYMDGNDVDEEAVRDALEGLIAIDSESGDPIYLTGYFDLGINLASLLSSSPEKLLFCWGNAKNRKKELKVAHLPNS